MTFLILRCLKFKNKVIASISAITMMIVACFFIFGFFIFPWIKYGKTTRLAFLILWSISVIEFITDMTYFFFISIHNDEKEKIKFKKDRVVYIFTFISGLVAFFTTFLLIFLKRNYNLAVSTFGLIAIIVVLFFVLSTFASILTIYKNNYRKMIKDISIAIMGILCLLLVVLSVALYDYYSSLFSIFIGVGASILVFLAIWIVCKTLFSKMFINKEETIPFIVIVLICMGIGLGLILRYTITDKDLQTILTSIFAAVLGGAITLMGVAWTIKRQDEKNKLDKIEEARPFIGIINEFNNRYDEADNNFIQFCRKDWDGDLYKSLSCKLINSDKAIFYIEKIVVDDVEYFPDTMSFIGKNYAFSISVMENKNWQPKSKNIKLVIKDINYQQRILEITAGKFHTYEGISEVA